MNVRPYGSAEQDVVQMASTHTYNLFIVQDGKIGCTDEVFQNPIELEPVCVIPKITNAIDPPPLLPPTPLSPRQDELTFLRIWFPNRDTKHWQDEAESLLKCSGFINGVLAYEILGNKNGIVHQYAINQGDSNHLQSNIKALHPDFEITCHDQNVLAQYCKAEFGLLDFYFSPPNYRSVLSIRDMSRCPLLPFYEVLSNVPEDAIAGLQILIQPARGNWNARVSQMVAIEQAISRMINLGGYGEWCSPPTGDSQRAEFRRTMSPNRLFAFRARAFVFGSHSTVQAAKDGMAVSLQSFSPGERRLKTLDEADYVRAFKGNNAKVKDMLFQRLAYAYGYIANQSELAAFCHFPTDEVYNSAKRMDRLVGFAVPDDLQKNGPVIGNAHYAGQRSAIRFPEKYRNTHCEYIGLIRMGKTTAMVTQLLHDIWDGRGVGLIYPHEKEVVDLVLANIPKSRIKDVIYICHCIPGYTLAFNHFRTKNTENPGKRADDYTQNIRCLYPEHWGANMEHLFHHGFYALQLLPRTNLRHLPILLDLGNKEGDSLRRKLFGQLEEIENPEPRRFWHNDLHKYGKADLKPIINKLSAISLDDATAKAFAYSGKPKFDIRESLDSSKIILIYEPSGKLGTAGDFDASLFISDFYHAAMSRSDGGNWPPFYAYIDELHRYHTRAIGDILRETAKFSFSLTVLNQQRSQLSQRITNNEMGNISNFVSFRTNHDDARMLERRTAGRISANDLLMLGRFDFIASFGEHLVRGRTILPEYPKVNYVREIMEHNLANYYVPDAEIDYGARDLMEDVLQKDKKRAYDVL